MLPEANAPGERDDMPAPARVVDALMSGHNMEKICQKHNLTRQRAEKILRAELRRIAIRPARDYAKLQIMRLEGMVGKLTEKANTGDLAAIDRMLRTLDRLDRYHGFAKRPQKPAPPDERDDEAFERKLAELADRHDRETGRK